MIGEGVAAGRRFVADESSVRKVRLGWHAGQDSRIRGAGCERSDLWSAQPRGARPDQQSGIPALLRPPSRSVSPSKGVLTRTHPAPDEAECAVPAVHARKAEAAPVRLAILAVKASPAVQIGRDKAGGERDDGGRESRESLPCAICVARLKMTRTRRVAYVHSGELFGAADCLPANEGRAWLVHSLVDAFSLVYDSDGSREGPARAQIIEPERASRADLLKFHDERYIGE